MGGAREPLRGKFSEVDVWFEVVVFLVVVYSASF
jgi:hypothetical protein